MLVKLKAVGLAAAAAVVMGAIASSGASAQVLEGEFDSASGFITANTTTHVFTAGGLSLTCPSITFSGTFTSPTKTLSATPQFPTNCIAFGVANTHYIDNGCEFHLVLISDSHSNGLTEAEANGRLECDGTGSITVTPTVPIFGSSACTVHFPEQNVIDRVSVTFNTAPTPDDITIGPNNIGNSAGPGGITYTITSTPSTGLCPKPGTYDNGEYDATATTVRAYSNAAHSLQVGGKLVTK